MADAYSDRGGCYVETGEYDKAIADFTEAIRLDPNVAAHVLRSRSVLRPDGRRRQGHRRLHRGHPARPERGGCLLRSGSVLCPDGRRRQAIADFTEAIRLDPTVADAYSGRGCCYARTGEDDKAIADFTEAIRLDPNSAGAYYNRGLVLRSRRANTTRPSPTSPRPSGSIRQMRSAYYGRGACYSEKGEHDKAIADFTEAIRLDPNQCGCTTSIEVGRYAQKGEYDKAIADFTEAIRLDPKSAAAYYNRARQLATTTRASTTRPSPTSPRPSGSIQKRGCLQPSRLSATRADECDKAIADFTEAIRLDPNSCG